MTWLLVQRTESPAPFWDVCVLALSLAATYGQAQKLTEYCLRALHSHDDQRYGPAAVARVRPVKDWLPLLRRRGLAASAAALHLTESDSTLDASLVARRLVEGGYGDDEVFGALLANGIGNAASLAVLREQGWELTRLVTVLVARGELLSDVRARLDGLGVARNRQRSLLSAHAAEDLLTLVLGAEDERARG